MRQECEFSGKINWKCFLDENPRDEFYFKFWLLNLRETKKAARRRNFPLQIFISFYGFREASKSSPKKLSTSSTSVGTPCSFGKLTCILTYKS